MKKIEKKLHLCRETLVILTLEKNKLGAGTDSLLICNPPLTTDTVRECCADI